MYIYKFRKNKSHRRFDLGTTIRCLGPTGKLTQENRPTEESVEVGNNLPKSTFGTLPQHPPHPTPRTPSTSWV